jgi:hypothetical protein
MKLCLQSTVNKNSKVQWVFGGCCILAAFDSSSCFSRTDFSNTDFSPRGISSSGRHRCLINIDNVESSQNGRILSRQHFSGCGIRHTHFRVFILGPCTYPRKISAPHVQRSESEWVGDLNFKVTNQYGAMSFLHLFRQTWTAHQLLIKKWSQSKTKKKPRRCVQFLWQLGSRRNFYQIFTSDLQIFLRIDLSFPRFPPDGDQAFDMASANAKWVHRID